MGKTGENNLIEPQGPTSGLMSMDAILAVLLNETSVSDLTVFPHLGYLWPPVLCVSLASAHSFLSLSHNS